MNINKNAALAFAKNRAEELGFDLWSEFVVPLYFDKLALDEVRKPLVFEGGRGCGKTTLLRYLSHATQLEVLFLLRAAKAAKLRFVDCLYVEPQEYMTLILKLNSIARHSPTGTFSIARTFLAVPSIQRHGSVVSPFSLTRSDHTRYFSGS